MTGIRTTNLPLPHVANDVPGDGIHTARPPKSEKGATAETAASVVAVRTDIGQALTEARVRSLIDLRGSRHRLFEGNLFSDPAWDMLLELYAAKLAERSISLSALCLLSRAPSSTVVRWIELLEQNNLVARNSFESDDERCLVTLSQKAIDTMAQLFDQSNQESAS